jgi:PilZ domain
MPSEKRKYRRYPLTMPVILETSASSSVTATIIDLSQGGACVRVAGTAALPDELLLNFHNGIRRQCRVVWRGGREIGVEFVAAPLGRAKPEPRHRIMIKCPRSDRSIATGIELFGSNGLGRLPNTRRYTRCRHCNVVHGWLPTEAFVEDVAS